MCSRVAAAIVASGLLALSCSVLEDRDLCPCILVLDLSDESNFACDSVALNLTGLSYSFNASVSRDAFCEPLLVSVPRTGVLVNVMDSKFDSFSGERGLVIPVGQQCPAVYMYSGECDTSQEETVEYVRLRKNYCGVSLNFVAENAQKYQMKIEGNVCGYNLKGKPMEGEFDYNPDFDKSSRCFFRLPRQLDQSLYLTIKGEKGASRRLSLGSYIVSSGYDWEKEDLDDIVVSIDYASFELRISINSWTSVVEENVII